jgi:hypothetical protein
LQWELFDEGKKIKFYIGTTEWLITSSALLNRICLLYGILEKEGISTARKGWVEWLSKSPFVNLTVEEIVGAHELALNGTMLNEKGEMFKVLPMLSNIQSADILRAYVAMKQQDTKLWKAREELKKLAYPQKTPQEIAAENEQITSDYCRIIFDELQAAGVTDKANFMWKKFVKNGKIQTTKEAAEKLYQSELKKLIASFITKKDAMKAFKTFDLKFMQKINGITLKEFKERMNTEPIPTVQENCRAILLSDYLRQFQTPEEIKNEIKTLQ